MPWDAATPKRPERPHSALEGDEMASLSTLAGLAAAAAGGSVGWLVHRYRSDQSEARARLGAFDRSSVTTDFGSVEYAIRGEGAPVLVSHGIFHGCDGGQMSVRDLLAGRQVIAPSRFGYLGSSMPAGATTADQADAFVALLDYLEIDRIDAIGISAGATAALQLALRHPDRVSHLVILAGNLPGGATAVAQPSWAKVFYTDTTMWTLKTLMPRVMARLSGVPPGFAPSPVDQRFVAELIDSLFPVAPRSEGIAFDAFVSNPDVNDYSLEKLTVPVLLIHAKDDPLASYDSAETAARRIPGSTLLSLDAGGHLTLGQTERVRSRIDAFFAETAVPPPEREPVR